MKLLSTILTIAASFQFCHAELNLPSDIAEAMSKSDIGETGWLSVHGADEQRFLNYICENWRMIADHIEELPKWSPAGGEILTRDGAINGTIGVFATACEWLPPEEYLEFLNKFADLREQGRISYQAFDDQIPPSAKKENFLDVNWKHAGVQAFLRKARSLTPESEKGALRYLDEVAQGRFEDNYMVNKSDDAPLPETLPGVKLARPFASWIRKIESITGQKIPPDPRFPDAPPTRTGKRSSGVAGAEPPAPEIGPDGMVKRIALAAAILLVLAGIALNVKRRMRNRV